jgi:integrase
MKGPTPKPFLRNGSYHVRLTVTVDGERVRRRFALETSDLAVAKLKVARLMREHHVTPDAAKASVSVAEYAMPWIERREALGIAATDYERRFCERVWLPAFGTMPIDKVKRGDVQSVLDAMATGEIRPRPRHEHDKPGPYSRQSIVHARSTIVRLFQDAWREELLSENRASRSRVPDLQDDGRPRATLTDAEIAQLIACPEADAEIKLLVLLSRSIGGLRAGDLNALDWTAFGPDFATCTLVRRKTRRKRPAPETFAVPEGVRPYLSAWHARQHCPESGPVFPVRRGERAGEAKKRSNMSYADRLRRELVKAGVTRHELHHETSTTRPVDFHSTRRAYAQALRRAGANEQTAMALTGHADSRTHGRYLADVAVRELPVGASLVLSPALPPIASSDAEPPADIVIELDDRDGWIEGPDAAPSGVRNANGPIQNRAVFSERDTRFELATPSLGSLCSTN